MTTSYNLSLRKGTIITGKWKQGRYLVERLLGEGANGKVYLVQRDRVWYALKVGADAVDLQSEINVLQSLSKLKSFGGGEPFLYDVDDFSDVTGKDYPFYTMRYVRGVTLSEYMDQNGKEWFPLVVLGLLNKLSVLHENGWVFGDLKVENILVADYGNVELVDYGGVTAAGKAVRQFTEIYDRGYWNAGSRSADARYDLFSLAVLCLQLHEPKRLQQLTAALLPQNRSPEELLRLAEASQPLRPVSGWLEQALAGRFASAGEAAAAWRTHMHPRRAKQRPAASTPGWLKGLFAGSALLLAASVYWFIVRGGM
ncbi:serine/threonine protein kinase [Paenibacillus sp. GCM10023252]|uniref:serine/threonine protein kinase n=1 Tax=Paenibacillus sp. GCM10023252 TaxID=3252649 RepID=UPI0036152988